MKIKHGISFLFAGTIVAVLFFSCSKGPADPHNPFDDIDRSSTPVNDTTNPRSFAGLHKRIFSTRCAVPGCHDGSFEPDFRSIQSAYSTLVYHPVKKKLNPWVYRVMPNDTAKSWLWQRINHDLIVSGTDSSEGRMPLYSSKLSATDRYNISYWILNGARDMFNQLPTLPNAEPIVTGFVAFNSTYTKRFDTTRVGNIFYNSFIVDTATVMNLVVGVSDDITPVNLLINNKIKLFANADPDDMTGAKSINGTYMTIGSNKIWIFTFNTNLFKANQTVYVRYYTNDGDHSSDTEFPRNDLLDVYKTLWSFKIIPQ